jgi:hypothetical protein
MFSEEELLTKFDNNAYDDLILISMQIVQHATLEALFFLDLESKNTSSQTILGGMKRKRRRNGAVFYMTDDGQTEVLPATASTWYRIYVEHPALDNKAFHKKFRRRFRMPYEQYMNIVADCKESDIFERWRNKDATGKNSVPLELLVLTALRYLGRGWTFDDLSESTGISEEVTRVFFRKFIEFGSTVLFTRYVVPPVTAADAEEHSHEFGIAGLPGAIGSMDATNILIDKVRYNRRQSHLGFKHSSTARTYNLVVNHRRRILGTTDGHPARWNDKTIVRFDNIAMGLKNGTLLDDDFIFELYDYDSAGNIYKAKYKGPWLIVDNGYHNWPITVPPFKTTSSRTEVRFSDWLESIRKDVECTFGILKGRWRILKTGIRLHGLDAADQIWKTCCALHNHLLEIDGLDSKWESGVPSDWEGSLGQHEDRDIQNIISLHRLNNPEEARNYDTSGVGAGTDRDTNDDDNEEFVDNEPSIINGNIQEEERFENTCIDVRKLPFHYFRSKLVTHFDIAYKKEEVRWPERNKVQKRSI